MAVLEKFYLSIVLKYMKYYDDVVEFVTINKKCLDVPKMIHFYPCERKSNQIKELKFHRSQLVLFDDTTFEEIQNMTIPSSLFDLFPNIETLELNGYDLEQPIDSNIKLIIKSLPKLLNCLSVRKNQIIALKNINLGRWEELNDIYFKETSNYLFFKDFPNLKYVSFISSSYHFIDCYSYENLIGFYEKVFGDLKFEIQTLVITLEYTELERTPEILKIFEGVKQIKLINEAYSFTRWFNYNKKDMKLIPIAERPKDENENEQREPICHIHYQDENFESLNFTKCATEPTLSINFGCYKDWQDYGFDYFYANSIEHINKNIFLPTTKVTRLEMNYCVRKSIIIPKNIVEAKLDNCFIRKIENKCKIQQLEITLNFPKCLNDINCLNKLHFEFVEIKNSLMKLTTIKNLSFKYCYFKEQKPFSYQLYPSSVTSLKIEQVKNWPKLIDIERLKELEINQTKDSFLKIFMDSKERNKKNGISDNIYVPRFHYYEYELGYNDYEDKIRNEYGYVNQHLNETKIENEFNLSRCNELNKVILKGMMNYYLPSNIIDLTICDGIILNKEMNKIKHKVEKLYVLNVDSIELFFSNLKYLVLINVGSIKTHRIKLNNKLSIVIKKCNFDHTKFEEYLKEYQYNVLSIDYFKLTKIMVI